MVKVRKLENHGRETYAVYYGDDFVLKRPLPNFGEEAQEKWLAKQYKTKQIIDDIAAICNPAYYIPKMIHINNEEMQLLEERAPGQHLTRELYRSASRRQQYEIRHGIASFLVDMNESEPVGKEVKHKISSELKFSRLNKFVE